MSNNSIVRISMGIGVATGVALIYRARSRRRNRSLLARTSEQARLLQHRASGFLKTAGTLVDKGLNEAQRQKKGVLDAMEAGKAAWQKTAG